MKEVIKINNKYQFSKLIITICIGIAVFGILLAILGSILFCLSEVVASATITTCGCIGVTSIVWYLKKSQAENTVKIYLGAYRKILKMKKEMNENTSETINQMEYEILGKLNSNISMAMDEATAPIERQDIVG